MEDLTNRVIIITGAAGGIGSAAARALDARGARLVLVDRSEEALAPLAAELAGAAMTLAADVTSEAGMAGMAEAAVARFGRIDALITSAAILRKGEGVRMISQTSFEEWRSIIDVNLTGTFLANRAVLPAMLEQKQGDIINLSSVSGRQGRAFDGPYSASKAGIIGLSESLSEEVARQGIRVQTVLPDAVDTGLWSQSGGVALKPQAMLEPARVAELLVYLLALPRDTYLLNPVIVPVPSRRRKAKHKS